MPNFFRSLLMTDVWNNLKKGEIIRVSVSIIINGFNSFINVLAPLSLSKAIETIVEVANNPSSENSYDVPILGPITPENLLWAYAGLVTGSQLLEMLNKFITADISENFSKRYAKKIIHKSQMLSYLEHASSSSMIQEIISQHLEGEVVNIPQAFIHHTIPLITDYSIGGGLLWLNIGYLPGIIFIVSPFLYLFVSNGIIKCCGRDDKKQAMGRKGNNYFGSVSDLLFKMETVRLSNREKFALEEVKSKLSEFKQAKISFSNMETFFNFIDKIPISIGNFAMVGIVNNGNLLAVELSDIVFLLGYMQNIFSKTGNFNSQFRAAWSAIDSMEKIEIILNKPNDNYFEKTQAAVEVNNDIYQQDIKFENVVLNESGSNSKKILDNISFTIPGGKTTAIVGYSGAGKTTVLQLLFRFYQLNSGAISIGGTNISNLDLRTYRSKISYVPQFVQLFPMRSIGYNIAYGLPDDEELRQFCKFDYTADANSQHVSLNSPEESKETYTKIETIASGVKLNKNIKAITSSPSGGETQRIGIARSLAKNSSIFVFDEATASLDAITEAEVVNVLNTISEGKTTIVVSHRLSSIQCADHIIAINEKGTAIEEGTHNTLLQKKTGIYSTLWNAQEKIRFNVVEKGK